MLVLGIALGLLGAVPVHVAAQQPGRMPQHQIQQQQMMRMQEQVHQLDQAMHRMTELQQRAQILERQMAQQMDRLQANREAAERNALELRNQERLRSMAQALGDGAQEMNRAMQQLRNMLGEPGAAWNGDMERDMLRLREHWEQMAGDLEEGLQIMERLRDRIHQTPEDTP
jgi:uncharacterized protein YukE